MGLIILVSKVFNYLPIHIKIYLTLLINLGWPYGIFFVFIYFILYRNALIAAVIYGPKL